MVPSPQGLVSVASPTPFTVPSNFVPVEQRGQIRAAIRPNFTRLSAGFRQTMCRSTRERGRERGERKHLARRAGNKELESAPSRQISFPTDSLPWLNDPANSTAWRGRTRVSLQLQQGFSTGTAAVSHDVLAYSCSTGSP